MKDTFFFSHDFGARNDPKLQNVLMEHGCEGLGVFWCVVEQIYEQGGLLPLSNCKSIAFALHVEIKVVESIVNNFGLFENDGETFWSASINNRLNKRAEIAQKRKNAAFNRWNKPQNYANAQSDDANAQSDDANAEHCNAIKGKERKGKERKGNISINREGLKAETAKRFQPPSIEDVKSYISEKGYSVDAESFIAFYTSKDWFVGKNKMKDWHAAIVTWEKRNKDFPAKNQTTKNVNDIWEKQK